MRRKLGLLLMIFGTVLLIGAISLLVYNYTDNKRAGKNRKPFFQSSTALLKRKKVTIKRIIPFIYTPKMMKHRLLSLTENII